MTCSHLFKPTFTFWRFTQLFIILNLTSQQTRDVQPMLAQCWATGCEAGPTFSQHWLNISCFLSHIPTPIVHLKTTTTTISSECYKRSTSSLILALYWGDGRQEIKWNESGFRPPLCTYRLNWARRTSWGWWDDWDDTALQTQDSKFEPWRSKAEHATSRSRRLPTILTFTRGWRRNIFVSFKPPGPRTEPRTLAWKAAVLTTTPRASGRRTICDFRVRMLTLRRSSGGGRDLGRSVRYAMWRRLVCSVTHSGSESRFSPASREIVTQTQSL